MKVLTIVTGGNSGLGLAIAKKLVSQGNNIAIIGRDDAKLIAAKRQLETINEKVSVLTFSGDITSESFVIKTFQHLIENWEIKELYNCAGIGRFGKPEANNREIIDITLGASLIGTILMCTSALKAMKKSGGVIVNVMSTAALKGNPNESVYCAAKWGAKGYTEALKAYLKGTNIKVIGVYPGGMKTPFWNDSCGMMPDINKFMNPDEVAEVIISAAKERKTMYVSDLTIDRR